MKKVSVIGHYGYGLNYLDGQTIKTKILTEELRKKYGEAEVISYDTHGGLKTLLKAPFVVWKAMRNSSNIIMLPAHNGLRIFGRLLPFFKRFFKNRRIYYVVIGGWLPKLLKTKKNLSKALNRFDGIYVETNIMKNLLEEQNFRNIFIMTNCKQLKPLSVDELVYQEKEPYKLCAFSRVMKEKGIEDAVEAVKSVNKSCGKIVYTLDIYGQVDGAQNEWFNKLKEEFPEYISYKGCVHYDKSVEVLRDYFALLFPTRFFTEGIPGTIIDAYAAGVPVISAKWQSFNDIVDNNITGIGYEFNCVEDLKRKLIDIFESVNDFNDMKKNCLIKSKSYLPSEVVEIICNQFI